VNLGLFGARSQGAEASGYLGLSAGTVGMTVMGPICLGKWMCWNINIGMPDFKLKKSLSGACNHREIISVILETEASGYFLALL
jgi:hypothetical protein